MCGLVGLMKHNMSLGYINKFKDLMVFAQLRGEDGAGIMSVPKGTYGDDIKHVNIKRTTWSSAHLVTLSDFDEVTKGDRSALFGHARQPTKGGTSIDNIHPHRSDHIILMHNGTMSHVGGESVPQGKSDSKMIAKYLVSHSPQEFVDNSYGAYCLIWIDMNKQTMNFLRNSERPLWFAEEKFTQLENSSTDALFWASEAWMMQMALSRYAGYSKERMKYYSLPKDEHWEFPLNLPHTIPAPNVYECKKTIKVTHYDHQANGYAGYGAWGGDEWGFDAWEDQTPKKEDKVTPPFNHAAGQNTNANLPVVRNSVGTTNNGHRSDTFMYIPPEHRQPDKPRTISIAGLLDESKRKAMQAAAANDKKKEVRPQSAVFPEKKISDYACTEPKRVRDLVLANPCVWCSSRPVFSEGTPTTIYPVRFSDDRREYVCAECIGDTDIQRAFGLG